MKVFSFLMASIVYVLGAGAIAFLVASGEFTLKVPFFEYTMPIYMWIIGVVGLYACFAFLHMFYYGSKICFRGRALSSDKQKFKKYILDVLLHRQARPKFKTPYYQEMRKYIDDIALGVSSDDDIQKVLDIKQRLDNEEVVELNGYGLVKDNPLYIQNEENKAKKDLDYAKRILKNVKSLESKLEKNAYFNILNNASYDDIRSLKVGKSADDICVIFNRFDDLKLSGAVIEVLLGSANLNESDVLRFAKILVNKLEPMQLIGIFEKLKEDERYLRGYFYTLAYFGNYEKLEEEYRNSQKDYDDFKLLMFLRDKSQKFDINDIVK